MTWTGDSDEGTFPSISQAATAHLSTTHGGGFTLSLFNARTSCKDINTNFYVFLFGPTWSRTYGFNYRLSSTRPLIGH